MLSVLIKVKTHLLSMVSEWLSSRKDQWLQTKATTHLDKHLKPKLVKIQTPMTSPHPFHTLFHIELLYSYKGSILGRLEGVCEKLTLDQLVLVERAALNKDSLTTFLVDSNEIIRNYAKSRYEELNK